MLRRNKLERFVLSRVTRRFEGKSPNFLKSSQNSCQTTKAKMFTLNLLDGITNPEFKMMCFIQLAKLFCKEKKALVFNRNRCCHLALCLRLSSIQIECLKHLHQTTLETLKYLQQTMFRNCFC
jgi:hypothetical protein